MKIVLGIVFGAILTVAFANVAIDKHNLLIGGVAFAAGLFTVGMSINAIKKFSRR